jgi:hypothetical protein
MSDQKNDESGKSRPALVKGHLRGNPWRKSVIVSKLVVRPADFRFLFPSGGSSTTSRGESKLESPSSAAKPQPEDGAASNQKKAE